MKLLGWLALIIICSLTTLAFLGLIGFNQTTNLIDNDLLSDPYFYQILNFSLSQALLSAALSVLLAWPVARSLYYLPNLFGQQHFLRLCLLCFVMPTLVLITGLLALLGNNGFLSPILGEEWNLYGLNGILIAHIYLNMPFAIRIIFQRLQSIPDPSWRLAKQVKLSTLQQFMLIEWPIVKPALLSSFGFIFVLCFNSFAVVLALGGGPASTTLELAIYQALKYDFNMAEALTLAWTQFAIAGVLFLLLNLSGRHQWLSIETLTSYHRPIATGLNAKFMTTCYALAYVLLLSPIAALFGTLLTQHTSSVSFYPLLSPLGNSILIAAASAITATCLAYAVLLPYRHYRYSGQVVLSSFTEWLATHSFVAPAMVLSVGLYIFLLPRFDLDTWGMIWVWVLNSAVLIPFAVAQIKPRLLQFDDQYTRLSNSLKLHGWKKLQVEWPFITHVCFSSLALSMLLAIGDIAIFSIFGNSNWSTLPWLIYSYASSYQLYAAAIASCLLLFICALIVWLLEKSSYGESENAID